MCSKHWYAVYTKSRAEKRVQEIMLEQGFTVYLPLVKTLRQWSDRKKKVEIPLIASYIFVNISDDEYFDVLNIPGVVAFVSFEGKAARIPKNQIDILQAAVNQDLEIEIQKNLIYPGEKVKIIAGPLKGAEGEFLMEKHKRNFILNMYNIGFALKIEVNASDVVKI